MSFEFPADLRLRTALLCLGVEAVVLRPGYSAGKSSRVPAQLSSSSSGSGLHQIQGGAPCGGGPRLLVKRDDAIPFGFGGNKIRKLEMVAAEALAAGADTLVTTGSVQSNHARATAAVAAKLGLGCRLILKGMEPNESRANTLLDELLGAEIEYVNTRGERGAAVQAAVERLRRASQIPYPVPLGASTSLGALGFVRAVGELLEQTPAPDTLFVPGNAQ